MKRKKIRPAIRKPGFKKTNNRNDISLSAQRQRLLERLRRAPSTTLEIRHEENILAPAARVYELRHIFGYNILTIWTMGLDTARRKHRVARYALINGKWRSKRLAEVQDVKS